MSKLLPLFIFLCCCHTAFAQAPSFGWARRAGSYNTTYSDAAISVTDMRLDHQGHVLTVGNYSGRVDFDPGAGIDTLSGYGNYLSRCDTAGNYQWVRKILPGASLQRMALDGAGNIYLTGYFTGTIDFDPGPGVYNVTSESGSSDIFLCKLTATGDFSWGYALGDHGNDWARSLYVDAQDNIYLTGFFSGTADFDPGPGVYLLHSLNEDPFFLKLHGDGTFAWAGNISGTANDQARDITADAQGNVYVTGSFTGTADFDPGANTYNLTTSIYSRNAFLLKLDSGGHFAWALSFGDPNDDWGDNVSLDAAGNPVISGYFSSVMDCDPGPGSYVLTPSYFQDFFAIKVSDAGNLIWARKFGLPGSGYTHYQPAIRHTLDAAGNVYLTGNFKDTADFDPGPGVRELTTVWDGVALDWGIFLLLLDNSGNYKWAGGFGQGGQGNWGAAIQVDDAHIYAAGMFNDTIDFDPGPAIHALQTPPAQSGSYGVAAYLLRLGVCTLDTQVAQAGNTLTAQAGFAAYQWVNCATRAAVPGATQRQFAPQGYGSFAVVLSQNNCADTSACHQIGPAGIHALQGQEPTMRISPNPVTADLKLEGISLESAALYDLQGKLLLSAAIHGRNEAVLQLAGLHTGCYLLKVTDRSGRVSARIISKL